VVQTEDPSSATGQPPAICIPSIDEVFPLDKCLQVWPLPAQPARPPALPASRGRR
jgi:hypothetical protein